MAQIYLQGKAKWAMLNITDKWGNWTINLYLTPDSKSKFQELDVKNHLKRDEDGDFVVLRRPQSKIVKGVLKAYVPPLVVDKEGSPTDVAIGNGSDVTAKCDYYSYKSPKGEPGKAIRLAGVRIDNLIPYLPDRDYSSDELKKAAGKLNEQPKQEDLF